MRPNLSDIAREYDKRRLIQTLRRNPTWSLAEIASIIDLPSEIGQLLGSLTIAELAVIPDSQTRQNADLINQIRLARAEFLDGPKFDALVLEVVTEAWPTWVASSFVRTRAGGPRWKLQASLGRLVRAGALERIGATSGTRYRIPGRAVLRND